MCAFIKSKGKCTGEKLYLQDCKCATVDRANCIRGCVRRRLSRPHSVADVVHRKRISRNRWNIHANPDRCRTSIHNRATNERLLKTVSRYFYHHHSYNLL